MQSIVDPDTAVPVGVGTIDGKFGAFQEKVKTSAGGIDLEAWQLGAASDLPPEVTAQIQREHVTDWLLGNFDAHGENFLTDQEGRIVGIDKEQAFRYMGDAKSHVMSYTYHPNSAYGETEPVYNTLFRRFAEEDIDLNLQDTLPYIKRVESIPDKEYREILPPLCRGPTRPRKRGGKAAGRDRGAQKHPPRNLPHVLRKPSDGTHRHEGFFCLGGRGRGRCEAAPCRRADHPAGG